MTKEQQARLPSICEKWRKIALSTEPDDRRAAERAVWEIYQRAGAKTKPKMIWLKNPLEYTKDISSFLSDGLFNPDKRFWRIGLGSSHRGAARYYKDSLVNEIERSIASIVPRLPPTLRFVTANEHGKQSRAST